MPPKMSRMPLIWPKINIALVVAENGHLPKLWTRCSSVLKHIARHNMKGRMEQKNPLCQKIW